MSSRKQLSVVIGSICLATSMGSYGAENEPSVAELWQLVQQQQIELDLAEHNFIAAEVKLYDPDFA